MAKDQEKHINYRMYLVSLVVLIMAIGIVVKLFNIQWIEGSYYRELAKERTVKSFQIPSNRGNIYSADGSLLATSIPKYKIRFDAVAPTQEDFSQFLKPLCDSLSRLTGKPSSQFQAEFQKARANKNRYVLVARNLSYTDYMRIKSFPLFNKGPYKGGIITEQSTYREHPIGLVAERTVGYERITSEGNPDGKGIEWAFRDYLQGKDGKRMMQKMAKGQWKPIRDENEVEPIDGCDVYSTIDVYIQDIAHHALLKQLAEYEADHGCVVVMETKTGAVKAISNLGRTANGNYVETINYAINESHEPGSTFKLVDLIALFEDKLADTSSVYDSKGGEITYFNRRVRDSKKGGYGKITLARGFELSSNTVLVQAVYDNYKNDPKKFVAHLNRMKLNEPLGLQIQGEGKPIIPQPGAKNWYGTTLPWMAYGYGVSMTPLQTLTLYNAVANNGEMVKPQFVSEIRQMNKTIKAFDKEVIVPQIASEETINKIKVVLENVVKKGTGSKLYSKDFSMAGKTGTAQVGYTDKSQMYYASSFVGYFPADQPKYSCIVVIHKPSVNKGYYGADVSGPVFKRIAQKVFTDVPSTNEIKDIDKSLKHHNEQYEQYYSLVQKTDKKVPDLVGMPGMDAIALLENMNVKVRVKGIGKVKRQSLKPGEIIKHNQIILLELS
jgi:cell division protein FtsI (penicillin-binding protein 3)